MNEKNPYSFDYSNIEEYKKQQQNSPLGIKIFNNLWPILEMDIRNASAAINGVTSV